MHRRAVSRATRRRCSRDVGLAAVISSSALAFSVVKYAGAAYLIYLGIRALREGAGALAERRPRERSDRRLYWEGFTVGALNPKLALFLLAFLPQFVDPAAGPVWLQTLILGSVFSACAAVGDSLIALAAAGAGSGLRRRLADPGPLSRAAGVDLSRPRRSCGARRRPRPVGGMSGLEPPLQSAA